MVKTFWIVVWICLLSACTNGADDLTGKWQLRYYESPDGTTVQVDNLFYNFQKGSFSIICILKDGLYESFFGNYSLSGDEISIILLPESVDSENYDAFVGWPEGCRTFKITELSSDILRLKYEGVSAVFRKY